VAAAAAAAAAAVAVAAAVGSGGSGAQLHGQTACILKCGALIHPLLVPAL